MSASIPPNPEPHCVTRARERYGIELTRADVDALAGRCRKGEGLQERMPDGKTKHALVFGDRVLWVVYLSVENELGIVVTIMPPDSIVKRLAREGMLHRYRRGERRTRRQF